MHGRRRSAWRGSNGDGRCDGAIGGFLNLAPGVRTTTLESKTYLLGASLEGSIALGETTPIQIGRATSVWQTRLTREDGK